MAMEMIAKQYEVRFYEPFEDITDADVILYWESPVTIQHPVNGVYYNKVRFNSIKKILLFSGGVIDPKWMEGFDLVLVESKINEKEMDDWGIPFMHAFGVNDIDFVYNPQQKIYDGMHHGTCASWKRQWLVGEALGSKGMVCGKYQEADSLPFDRCKALGCQVLPEMLPPALAFELNSSHTLIQSSDYWGGGQRATLEAMACGVPPIVMEDSPKCREYVEEAGFGLVVKPTAEAIREAVQRIKDNPPDAMIGVNYVKQRYTAEIYKNQILEGIKKVVS